MTEFFSLRMTLARRRPMNLTNGENKTLVIKRLPL